MSSKEPYRGIVSGILSGDSLIIRFVDSHIVPTQNVCLEHLIAPKFGKSDGQQKDEPHAFSSWDFLRNLCIGQRVYVYPPTNKTELTRSHSAFGKMPVMFSRVQLCEKGDDVGLICVQNGWVKIRSPKTRDYYVNSLYQGEAMAQKQKLGIWGSNGFVRPLPVLFDDNRLLEIGEFDAIVESVINGTTVGLFLMPNHEHIVFQIAACRSPSAKKDNTVEFGNEAKYFTVKALLHRSTRVRLYKKNRKGSFLGSILDRLDRSIRALISEGLAKFNPSNADISPSAFEYERCECEARAHKKNIWKNEPDYVTPIKSITGIVRRIVGSYTLEIDVRNEYKLVQLNCISAPPYIFGGGSEPFGFEAREMLRKLLVGKQVTAIIDGAVEGRFYATVYYDNKCINELMCKKGLARSEPPVCGKHSEKCEAIRKAEEEAKKSNIGIYSKKQPPLLKIRDYSSSNQKDVAVKNLPGLKGIKMRGIIEDVLGGNRFTVLIPERNIMLRLAVNGILPISINDKIGPEVLSYSVDSFLNQDIIFDIVETDRNGGYIANIKIVGENNQLIDIASSLLSHGYAELHRRTSTTLSNYAELEEIQNDAINQQLGKWEDNSKYEVELDHEHFYPVRILRFWSLTKIVVQFLSDSMKEIDQNIKTHTSQVNHQLMKNDFVCVVFEGVKYRAKVEKFDDFKHIRVRLVDYDISVDVPIEDVYEIPPAIENIPYQAITVNLAFIRCNTEYHDYCIRLTRMFKKNVVFMHLIYHRDGYHYVYLFEQPDIKSRNLNSLILNEFNNIQLDKLDVYDDYYYLLDDLQRNHKEEEERFQSDDYD